MAKIIEVAARQSPLSRAQVTEVYLELKQYYPEVSFNTQWVLSTGDKDKTTSLRTMGKTDFFTKEVDDLLLKGECRIGIHSAKDLPDPLTTGLAIVAITKGVDSSDVLVLREGETLQSLPSGSIIATSSMRREENVRLMRNNLNFTDIRGTIGERLDKLFQREVDGVVIAKAALIRLGLHDLNEYTLPGETTPLQGQLAIVARADDNEMHEMFECISCFDNKLTPICLN
jgi:hydroxymethylbilane synthase